MSHDYRMVQWNKFKLVYDGAMMLGLAAFVAAFIYATLVTRPADQAMSEPQILIRALGAAAFGLLNFILIIGPAARLSDRFKPLLYNRRHLGVACFLLALAHAGLTLLWYHGFSRVNPFVSLLISNPRYDSIQGFPFESLGLAALAILFVMAATSHDFWNANLGPRAWKSIHMFVYGAYALLVAHVMLGAVQFEKSWLYPLVVGAGAALVAGLHLFAGWRETKRDARADALAEDGWLMVGAPGDIRDGCAKIITPPEGERIAVFRDGAKLYALSNLCRHQGGPLGEGRIVDGCVVCPWHGFQYRPEDGASPPPFTEKVSTYRTRIVGGAAYVHREPLEPGTPCAPSLIEAASGRGN
jgi:DMSO/TMAO reductase YedYZ heme-binding membrane subunit/nitrite reductase/ring-hydroxylating ferredoxin subunit